MPMQVGGVSFPSLNKLAEPFRQMTEPLRQLAEGSGQLPKPFGKLPQGFGQFSQPSEQLAQGFGQLTKGSRQLSGASRKLAEGSSAQPCLVSKFILTFQNWTPAASVVLKNETFLACGGRAIR